MALPPPHHSSLNRSPTASTAPTAILSLPQSLLNPRTSPSTTKPLLSFSQTLTLTLSPPLSSRCSRVRVSTVPVEYVPPAPDFNFLQELTRLKSLHSRLARASSIENKLDVLNSDPRVRKIFNSHARPLDLTNLSLDEVFVLKCLVAVGQEHVLDVPQHAMEREVESARSSVKSALFALVEMIERLDGNGKERVGFELGRDEEFDKLLRILGEMERFYDCIGGIIG